MPNEEVLGPRKTMFILVIVMGCFAVLWPRILAPLLFGYSQDQLKPNKLDRDAGCCDIIFESEVAVLEIINEVCNTVVQGDVKLSPYAAAECRRSVNETCGLDIVDFLKRSNNVGKTSKMLLDTMKASNSSCLKEHFGVTTYSLTSHQPLNSWMLQDTLKQERPLVRASGPHPALRERGRAIPAGVPTPPSRGPVPLPPHVRVRSSPLSVYYELDIKPPPIPGMRPPLGSPGGPVPAPKSSMGFVMPIYTICIIIFFVYTLCKIMFRRATAPYEPVPPDTQFRRRVFRDDSRSTPDKLVVTAISGLVAEVQQQMEASYAQNQQRQDQQDNHARPYTNGTILLNSGPVHIVASEYRESKERSPEPQKEKEASPEPLKDRGPSVEKESEPVVLEPKEEESVVIEPKNVEQDEAGAKEPSVEDSSGPKTTEPDVESKEEDSGSEPELITLDKDHDREAKVPTPELNTEKELEESPNKLDELVLSKEELVELDLDKENSLIKATEDFINNARILKTPDKDRNLKSTPELLEEALKDEEVEEVEEEEVEVEEEEEEEEEEVPDNASVKHKAEEVKSIFLETEIPQQSRVLVAEFAEKRADKTPPTKHSPMVVSGKMTLSLIQDAPRETPERDPESTVDDFTTASGVTLPAAEKQEELSDEEIEEEIEVEEIEEEVEEEEEVDETPRKEPK